jgi:hypothetical protein
VDLIIGDAKVEARSVGTGEACGVHTLGSSPPAFDLSPGTYRSMRWLSSRRGRGGKTTGGAVVWAARLEQTLEPGAYLGSCSRRGRTRIGPAKRTQQHQREDEQEHEQVHLVVHEESSWLEMRRRDLLLLRRKNKERREGKSSG